MVGGVTSAGSADEEGEGRADAFAAGAEDVGNVALDRGVKGVGFGFDLGFHFDQLILNEFERELEGGGGFGLCEKFHKWRLGRCTRLSSGAWS